MKSCVKRSVHPQRKQETKFNFVSMLVVLELLVYGALKAITWLKNSATTSLSIIEITKCFLLEEKKLSE